MKMRVETMKWDIMAMLAIKISIRAHVRGGGKRLFSSFRTADFACDDGLDGQHCDLIHVTCHLL